VLIANSVWGKAVSDIQERTNETYVEDIENPVEIHPPRYDHFLDVFRM